MGLVKYLLELVLLITVIFFTWNVLKRLFFQIFYRVPGPAEKPRQNENAKPRDAKKHGLNWDAETIDYEEIKDEEKS